MQCRRLLLNKRRCAVNFSQQPLPSVTKPLLKTTTSYYGINPDTKTEATAHDIKAASLTKALYIDTLPGPMAQNIELNKDNPAFRKSFRKTVFESFFFEPQDRRPEKPKRDRKPNQVVGNTVLTQFIKMFYHLVDHSKCDLVVDKEPYFEQNFTRKVPEFNSPVDFLIKGSLGYNILSTKPVQPFFDMDLCLQTKDHPIQWEDIIHSTLDIEKIFHLNTIVPGISSSFTPSHPYLRMTLDTCNGAEWDDTSRARGIYFLFARLASEALRDGAKVGLDLPEPRCGIYLSTSAYSYHYVFYQLNTLALEDDLGIKNLAWGHSIENITSALAPYRMVQPEDLLGPEVLNSVMDYTRAALFYNLPLKENVSSTFIEGG